MFVILCCFFMGKCFNVCILCKWFVSLIKIMWIFCVIVMNIFWWFLVCCFLCDLYLILLSFVILFISMVILLLKIFFKFVSVIGVFFMILCKNLDVMVDGFIFNLIKMLVIWIGWIIYGLFDLWNCFLWELCVNLYVFFMSVRCFWFI